MSILSLYRQAFTLIEILIVVAIILLLSALLLIGLGSLRENAEITVTKQRMDTIRLGLLERSKGQQNIVEGLYHNVTDNELRFRNLHQILSHLVKEHGLKPHETRYFKKLPPGLASIYDIEIGCLDNKDWRPLKKDPEEGVIGRTPTLKNVMVFRCKRDFTQDTAYTDENTLRYRDETNKKDRTYLWYHKKELPEIQNGIRWSWVYSHKSINKESLHHTAELVPDGLWEAEDYLDRWPLLKETTPDDGETLYQQAWEDSDWDQEDPGDIPPIWEVPFGHEIIARTSGERATGQYLLRDDQDELRHLGDFSPLASTQLLVRSGVIEEHMIAEFRTDRNREQPFNDRWGNPIIISFGMFISPRYGLDDSPQASHGKKMEFYSDLNGGRDWLRQRSAEVYGYASSLHFSVGVLGPQRLNRGTDNPIESDIPEWENPDHELTWTAPQDKHVLRAAWLQIRELCQAEEFTDDRANNDPPWSGIVKGYDDQDEEAVSLLMAPSTIH